MKVIKDPLATILKGTFSWIFSANDKVIRKTIPLRFSPPK